MTSINAINVNAQGIGSSYGYGVKSKAEEKEKAEPEVGSQNQATHLPADDVLSFMAQSAVVVAPAKSSSVDPAKYVDNESAARIAGFMSQFEDIVATNLTAISAEFPGMSDSAKQTLALANIKE